MKYTIIAAHNNNKVIGRNGRLPWRCAPDLEHFKQTTEDEVLLVGRKTADKLPYLERRDIIVLTSDKEWKPKHDNMYIVNHWSDIELAAESLDTDLVYIAGGESIYCQSLFMLPVTEMIITHINNDAEGDTYFRYPPRGRWDTYKMKKLSDNVRVFYYELSRGDTILGDALNKFKESLEPPHP